MKVIVPQELLPALDIVANPSVLYDGEDAYVCYKSADDDGGNVVLRFSRVIDFRISPMNVDGLKGCRYPIEPWAFNEIIDGEETARWASLNPRFWLISFRDVTIEILFDTVSVVYRGRERVPQSKTLMRVLAS